MPRWQDTLVRRLHMRVRADNRRHLPVKMPAHGQLLRRGFGVKVDDDHGRALLADARDLLLDDGKGIVERRHEDAAHDIDDADDRAAGRSA